MGLLVTRLTELEKWGIQCELELEFEYESGGQADL